MSERDPRSSSKSPLVWLVAGVVGLILAVLGWRAIAPGEGEGEGDDPSASEGLDSSRATRSRARASTGRARLDLASASKASISGTVRDEAGRPIAGASVCAIADREALRGADQGEPVCTQTGGDGFYRIDGLWPVETRISASAPERAPGAWFVREADGDLRSEIALQPGASVDGLDIVLVSGGVLVRGVVKDISGGEIEGARITSGDMSRGMWSFAFAVTDEAGAFEIWVSPGVRSFRASSDGYARGAVDAIAPGEFVEIYLTPESVLVGRVVLAESGEPVVGATVVSGRRGAATQSGDDGSFRIAGLEPGIYKPSATSDERYGEAAEEVHLGLGETSDMVEIRVHPAALVTGRVLIAGDESRPCEDGSVMLIRGERREWSAIQRDGSVELRGVLPGAYEVEVRCDGCVAEDSYPDLVVDADVGDQIWEVHEGLAMRGVVVDSRGEGVRMVSVFARPVLTEAGAARAQTTPGGVQTQDDGSFSIEGLLPGSYEVNAATWGDEFRPPPLEPLRVELEPGADRNDLRLELPETGALHGRIVDARGEPVSGVAIRAELLETGERFGQAPSTRSDDAGEFRIDYLRPGQTRVSARDGGRWWGGTTMRAPGTSDDDLQGEVVTVVGGDTVEVELVVESRGGVIRGSVRDEAGGPVADAFIDIERMPDRAGANSARALRQVRWSWNAQPVLTDADGSFALEELPDGQFVVRAHRKGGGEAVLEGVTPGSVVELVIAQTGEIAGVVRLADGGAPERFSVVVRDRSASFARSDDYLRTEGAFRLRELPAGHYEVSARSDAGTAQVEIDLGEGEAREDLELTLETLLTVRGRLVAQDTGEPIPGLEVFVRGRGGGGFRFRPGSGSDRKHVSDADGRFEVEDAPSGSVTLVAWSMNQGEDAKYQGLRKTITLEPKPQVQDIGDVEVLPTRLGPREQPGDLGFTTRDMDPGAKPEERQATVALVRPDGPAAATELAVGDVIETVDGQKVTGLDFDRYRQLVRAPPGTKLSLGIEGGKTVTVVLGPPR